MAGLPDVMGFFKNGDGRFFGVEVKSSIGKLRSEQKEWQDKFAKHGVTYWVVRDFITFKNLLTNAEEVFKNVN